MTKSIDPNASGESKLKSRRSAFFKYTALAFIVLNLAGVAGGYLTQGYEDGLFPLWLPLMAGAALAAGFVWFTWDYFQRVDELDLLDNLWAHMIGFYGGLVCFGAWLFLYDLALTPPPHAGISFLMMLAITFLAYGLRKLGWR